MEEHGTKFQQYSIIIREYVSNFQCIHFLSRRLVDMLLQNDAAIEFLPGSKFHIVLLVFGLYTAMLLIISN